MPMVENYGSRPLNIPQVRCYLHHLILFLNLCSYVKT